MKAFLSHSSSDKEFVRAVARQLGRQYCVFDEQVFSSGDEFKQSIVKGLDESSAFILFASRKSLESVWVKFEAEEAWYKKLSGNLGKAIVYIIDSSIDYKNLPDWLTRTLVKRETSPQAIARDIGMHLRNLMGERQRPYFVGRTDIIQELENRLLPIDGSIPPRVIFLTGLPGIGRRSLVFHATPKLLNFKKHIEIRLKNGDTINDICLRVADRVEPYSTQIGFRRLAEEIKLLPFDLARTRTLNNLRTLCQNSELPLFYDEGGLLDSEGYIQKPILALLQNIEQDDDLYLFLISTRKPRFTSDISYPIIQIPPLSGDDTKRLLGVFAHSVGLIVSPKEINELMEYVSGYPPAIYFAIRQAKDYGLESV
jgi:hypothetical protein